MKRRRFLEAGTVLLTSAAGLPARADARKIEVPPGKKLRTVFNNDIDNILWALDGDQTTPEQYRHAVGCMLDARPGVLAQNVGLPDPVIYPSRRATAFDKHLVEVTRSVKPWQSYIAFATEGAVRQAAVMRKLRRVGTDPLTLTIEVCRKRGVPIVASYRMNAEEISVARIPSGASREQGNWTPPFQRCMRTGWRSSARWRTTMTSTELNSTSCAGRT
jgi:hypothetical protein